MINKPTYQSTYLHYHLCPSRAINLST